MRIFGILPAACLLGGCFHLGAEPMTFTGGAVLDAHTEVYTSPLIEKLQRDADVKDCPTGEPGCRPAGTVGLHGAEATPAEVPDPIIAKTLDRWRDRAPPVALRERVDQAGPPVLMLSGGGGWGAFGAGYLEALSNREWAIVTGVSTGALQGLFVAAGDYAEMVRNYSPAGQSDIARRSGLWGVLLKGAEFDLTPLRAKLMDYLLPPDGAESPLVRMLRPDAPELAIGIVEARTGDFKVVHVTEMVRSALGRSEQRTPAELRRIAECVAGVALASSAIPVRLTPVQIDGRTYVDGGVRSSVFDAALGRRLSVYADARPSAARPQIYVIRNGPTTVFPDVDDRNKPGRAEVDARPDAMRVGLRGYSTIVNQSELMSIIGLRLAYPIGSINVATADGYDKPMNPDPCVRNPDAMFDPTFMRCLVRWGRRKAVHGPDWIELPELAAPADPTRTSN